MGKFIRGVSLTLTVMLLISGCGSKASQPAGTINQTQSASTDWVAKVNGDLIFVADYEKRLNSVEKSYEQQGIDFNSAAGKQQLNSIKQQVVDDMIVEDLAVREAKKLGIVIGDSQVSAEIQQIKNNLKGPDGKPDEAKYMLKMIDQGTSESSLEAYLKTQLTIEALYNKVTADVSRQTDKDKKFSDYLNQLKHNANIERAALTSN